MKERHPIIAEWVAELSRDREDCRQGRGRMRIGFNRTDYRGHRILSQIFFALERHGVEPISYGHPHFCLGYKYVLTSCGLKQVRSRIPGTNRTDYKLLFYLGERDAPQIEPYREWTESTTPLEEQIPEIIEALIARTRANAKMLQEKLRCGLEERINPMLSLLKDLEENS